MRTIILQMILSVLIIGIFMMTSCKDDKDAPVLAPKAEFEAVKDGKTVTFTNKTTGDGVTYAWDFGDEGTSTEVAPSHTFAGNGSYVVKLTATNEGGKDDATQVLEIINITIDGDFSDWDDVEYAVHYTDGEGVTLTGLKLENLSNNKLYVYVEGTAELTDLMQIFLNTDNDVSTGAQITWRYAVSGEDYMIEGNIPTSDDFYANLSECVDCAPSTWGWTLNEGVTEFVTTTALTSKAGGKAFEFSIDLSAFPTEISSESIGIAIMDMSIDTWQEKGGIPQLFNETTNPDAALYMYTLK